MEHDSIPNEIPQFTDPYSTPATTPAAPPPPAPPSPPSRPRSRLLPYAVIATVAALGGGGVAALAVRDDGGTPQSAATTVTEAAPDASGTVIAATTGGKTIPQIYRSAAPGVVAITANGVTDTTTTLPQQQGTSVATGSGFVIDADGSILTNEHVVDGASSVYVAFADGTSKRAEIVGVDKVYDLALLHVSGAKDELKPLTLGSSKDVQVGETVVAIGNPYGYDRSATAGIVSAVGRSISSPDGSDIQIPGAIQTDAAINHGNSGGPLLDSSGDVIGINAQITSRASIDANIGIGFAIPIDLVKGMIGNLRQGKSGEHPYIGVNVAAVTDDVRAADSSAPSRGLAVQSVGSGSPADKGGLKAGTKAVQTSTSTTPFCLGGDTIVGIDGASIGTTEDLQAAIGNAGVGHKVKLDVVNNKGDKRTVSITVGPRPSQQQRVSSACAG